VDFHHAPAAGARVEAVHVLRHQQEVMVEPLHRGDDTVGGIGLCSAAEVAPPVIPFPYQLRIAHKCIHAGQFFRFKFFPNTVITTKGSNTALGGYSRTR
jgi:hypothetical protein